MVKALVTIEGVGYIFDPEIDIPSAARKHVQLILLQEFNPLKMLRDSALILPEMMDVLRKSPLILTRGLMYWSQTRRNLLWTFEWPTRHATCGILLACRSYPAGISWSMVRLGSFFCCRYSTGQFDPRTLYRWDLFSDGKRPS